MLKINVSQSTAKDFPKNDKVNTNIAHFIYDATEQALVATNGVSLVKIYLQEPCAYTDNALIPIGCFPRKAGNTTEITFTETGYMVTELDKRGVPVEQRLLPTLDDTPDYYPEYSKVFPTGDKQPLTDIKFNPAYLTAFDKLKNETLGKASGLELSFFGEASPIMVGGAGHFTGLIAPMRK